MTQWHSATVTGKVSNSVMPKGVEHTYLQGSLACSGCVSNSVMPKGVEHITPAFEVSFVAGVSNSVMPKGVEHTSDRRGGRYGKARVEFSDAERR